MLFLFYQLEYEQKLPKSYKSKEKLHVKFWSHFYFFQLEYKQK